MDKISHGPIEPEQTKLSQADEVHEWRRELLKM